MNGILGAAFGIITMALFFAVPAIVGATLAIGTAQFADIGSQWCIEREKIKRPAMQQRKKERAPCERLRPWRNASLSVLQILYS
jgi:hypothetical protein